MRRFDPEGFFNTGSNVNNSLTFSTGTQKHQTYFSAATTNARNILPNSGYNRYNFTFRDVTKFLKDKLTVDLSASYILQDNKNMIAAGKYFNPLPALYLFPRATTLTTCVSTSVGTNRATSIRRHGITVRATCRSRTPIGS